LSLLATLAASFFAFATLGTSHTSARLPDSAARVTLAEARGSLPARYGLGALLFLARSHLRFCLPLAASGTFADRTHAVQNHVNHDRLFLRVAK
jgi:hypothetical protein